MSPHVSEQTVSVTKKSIIIFIWKYHMTNAMERMQKHICNILHLQARSLTLKNKSRLLITSVSSKPMTCNTIVSLENLTCTDYMDFRNSLEKFGLFVCAENDSK